MEQTPNWPFIFGIQMTNVSFQQRVEQAVQLLPDLPEDQREQFVSDFVVFERLNAWDELRLEFAESVIHDPAVLLERLDESLASSRIGDFDPLLSFTGEETNISLPALSKALLGDVLRRIDRLKSVAFIDSEITRLVLDMKAIWKLLSAGTREFLFDELHDVPVVTSEGVLSEVFRTIDAGIARRAYVWKAVKRLPDTDAAKRAELIDQQYEGTLCIEDVVRLAFAIASLSPEQALDFGQAHELVQHYRNDEHAQNLESGVIGYSNMESKIESLHAEDTREATIKVLCGGLLIVWRTLSDNTRSNFLRLLNDVPILANGKPFHHQFFDLERDVRAQQKALKESTDGNS